MTLRLPEAALAALVARALHRVGMAPGQAGPVAAGLAACERDGVKGHGLLRLPALVNSVRLGWVDGQAVPVVVEERPAAPHLHQTSFASSSPSASSQPPASFDPAGAAASAAGHSRQ